jgi:magnesium chelatase subunit D
LTEVDSRVAVPKHVQLAARLFVHSPNAFKGIILRGAGPVRDALLAEILAVLERSGPVHKIPINVDNERLLGGIDLAETLRTGRSVRRTGLLESARGGVIVLQMAERVQSNVAAHIAQAMDCDDLAVVILDDGLDPEELPPTVLMERAAFHCEFTPFRSVDDVCGIAKGDHGAFQAVKPLGKGRRAEIAGLAAIFGIESVRPLVFAEKCAVALAAMDGRQKVTDADIGLACQLVLAPRATQMPSMADPEIETPPPPPDNVPEDGKDEQSSPGDALPQDMMLEAIAASIPSHILDQIEGRASRSARSQAGKSGQKHQSARHGRPMGFRSGVPGGGKRLALIETLRAAAPWQTIRRKEIANANSEQPARKILLRKSDLRVHHFEQRQESLTIFLVDASGSSAMSRLAEAKGAVELMLAQAYVKRSQVALIAFRGTAAEILLPPTRSLTRARRALGALPGGGGTPLASGLMTARQMAELACKRGQTPLVAVLTDGKANVMIDGNANRSAAMEEAGATAKAIAMTGINTIVIDISPRPRAEAAQLADDLRGKYLPLPRAHSRDLVSAIESIGTV